MEIWCVDSNDLGILVCRFWQQVLIGTDQVGHVHIGLVRVTPRANDVPFEIDRVQISRSDREHTDAVPIVNFECLKLFRNLCVPIAFRNIEAHHRLVLVSDETLHLDVPQRRCRKEAARQLQHRREILFILQFVDRRTAHHTVHCHLRTDRRYLNGIAIVELQKIRSHAVQKQIVEIDFLHQLAAAEMLDDAHRAFLCRAARNKQSVQRRGERTDVVCTGIRDITDFINSNCAQLRERDVCRNIVVLSSKRLLQVLLHLPQVFSADQHWANFRQAYPAFAVYDAINSLRDAAPQIDRKSVAWPDHILRAGRNVHRDQL